MYFRLPFSERERESQINFSPEKKIRDRYICIYTHIYVWWKMVVMHDSYVWFEYFWIIKKYKKIMILFNYIKKS